MVISGFISDGDGTNGEEWEGGDVDECYCTASSAASNCEVSCPAMGDLNGVGVVVVVVGGVGVVGVVGVVVVVEIGRAHV